MNPFELLAMCLDTLPFVGRILLLSLLLSIALYGATALLKDHPSAPLRLLLRKGALWALVGVPVFVAFLGVEMPVYVEQARAYGTPVPSYVAYALTALWLLGVAVCGVRFYRSVLATGSLVDDGVVVDDKAQRRVEHWSRRLSLDSRVSVKHGGGHRGWHFGNRVRLPMAAQNWKAGVLDAALLVQLAQIKQRTTRWIVFRGVVEALYWPCPWVGRVFEPLPDLLAEQALTLAASAYRDPEGWRRDAKALAQRYETHGEAPGLALPTRLTLNAATPPEHAVVVGSRDRAKARRAARHFDPYERVYWVIAVVSIFAGVGTTLTIEQASPEFEPSFLNIRWQDQMQRRLTDTTLQTPRERAGRTEPSVEGEAEVSPD